MPDDPSSIASHCPTIASCDSVVLGLLQTWAHQQVLTTPDTTTTTTPSAILWWPVLRAPNAAQTTAAQQLREWVLHTVRTLRYEEASHKALLATWRSPFHLWLPGTKQPDTKQLERYSEVTGYGFQQIEKGRPTHPVPRSHVPGCWPDAWGLLEHWQRSVRIVCDSDAQAPDVLVQDWCTVMTRIADPLVNSSRSPTYRCSYHSIYRRRPDTTVRHTEGPHWARIGEGRRCRVAFAMLQEAMAATLLGEKREHAKDIQAALTHYYQAASTCFALLIQPCMYTTLVKNRYQPLVMLWGLRASYALFRLAVDNAQRKWGITHF